MHSVTSNAVADSLSYSTTEQLTGGVWIDGKPIYRLTIRSPLSGATTTIATISNLSEICFQMGHYKKNNGYVYPNWYSANAYEWFRINTNNGNVDWISTDYSSTVYVFVILEYTKTTD